MSTTQDRKVAPNIWRTATGWRVFIRIPDPVTGKSRLSPKRFKDDGRPDADQLADLEDFRDSAKLASKRARRHQRTHGRPRVAAIAAAGFRHDADRYLALEVVKAMPAFDTREREIEKWKTILQDRPRLAVTTQQIEDELQRLYNTGYAGSSVNKFRTALMHLFTKLDGKAAANPVKATRLFPEADLVPRAQSYDVLSRILDDITEGKSRARLELLAWTGIEPKQIKRLTPQHVNLRERWYVTPQRLKGSRQPRQPRPVIRKAMSTETAAAFARFIEADAWGPFSTDSLRRVWNRAQARIETMLRTEYGDPAFTLPHIRLKDLRHSFGTELYAQTGGNREVVGQMLDHAPGSPMTLRYALAAVPIVLRQHMEQFRGRKAK